MAEPDRALFTDVEFIDRPDLRLMAELVEYWDRKRAGRIGPRRADIDPTEIAAHLAHIFMADVIEGGADFRYRLIGTRIVEGLGRDNTGKRLSELYRDQPRALAQLKAVFRMQVERKAPLFTRGRVFWLPEATYRRFTGASMPLSDDGATVNIILAEMFVEHGGRLDGDGGGRTGEG
ncbi:MAG TPA: PAS domain-containing protein [Stellaceae bacterium]|nr:PAS domain-containing protein [Stellaceae bacterium]